MALDRYVKMRKAYEKEQDKGEQRKEPALNNDRSDDLDNYVDYRRRDDQEACDGGFFALSPSQKVMVGLALLVVVVASAIIYRVPAIVTTEFFQFGTRAPIRIMEMLQWNKVAVLLPFLFVVLSFLYNRSNRYLGFKMLLAAVTSSSLVFGVSAAFSYFVVSVGT